MIGTSTIELIFIRVSITLLRSITPLSILYCLSLPFLPQRRLFYVVAAWPIAETAFYFLLYLPRERSLQRAAQHPPLISKEERQTLFERCLNSIPDTERYLTKWFMDA